MANAIDLIVSKNAVNELQKTYELLGKTHDEIVKISKMQIDFNGGSSPKNPAQMQKVIADFQKMEQASNRATAALAKNAERQRLAEIKLSQDREKAFSKYEAQLNKEQQKLAAAGNAYNKLQTELNKLNFAYQNLAVRQAQGVTLTKAEAQQMDYLRNRIQMHDKTLKAVDATVGKYTRNVGNYASGFNPLSNSINQLTREAPAFANSVQTGFMAISNNLPIFFDAMGNVIAQNKELQAQGKPTQSVLSQLAGSLFSFQTLLGVGVTLLTVYGKEIVNWTSSLFGASQELEELNKNQKDFNDARINGRKNAQSDIIELKKYLAVYNDVKLSDEDRKIAFDKISKQYPYYIKNVNDAIIANGKYSEGIKKLLVDLGKQKSLEGETEAQVKNKQKLIDLEKELSILKKLEIQKEKDLDTMLKSGASSQSLATISNELRNIQQKRIKTEGEVNEYQNKINSNQIEIIRLTKERIGLEYTEDKQRKQKVKQLREIQDLEINQADYLAREYELRKEILDNLIKNNDEVVKDETKSLSDRIDAYNRFIEYKKQLVQLEYNEQSRVIETELKDQTKEINSAYNEQLNTISEALKEGTTTQTIAKEKRNQALVEKDNALKSLEKKILIDRQINTEHFVQSQKELSDEYSKEVINKLLIEFEKLDKQNEIAQSKLNALTNRAFNGGTLNMKSPLSAFKTYFEDREKIEEEATIKSIELNLNETKLKIANSFMVNGIETEEHKKLIAKKIELETQLQNVKDKNQEKELKRIEELKKTLEEYYSSFGSDLANKAGFGKLLGLFTGDLEKFEEDATATALAVSEAFQEAFNTISQMSNAYFEREFLNLERQRNLSIKFAGESTSAKESIEKQYDERRKQLERRQAEQRKRLAIFNAVVDTAQGVVGAIARADLYPYNFVLAGIIGALGAAQIAMISSQQVPAYAEGTDNHGGGLMLINDGKGSNYTETVETPDGKLKQYKGRNVLVNAPKGTKVHTHEQWNEKLNNLLVSASINHSKMSFDLPIINNNGISETEFNAGISKLANVIQSKESITLVRDEKGERIYKKLEGQRQQIINARLNIKGYEL